MDASLLAGLAPVSKRVAPYILAVVVGGAGIGYAAHEHSQARTQTQQAQSLAAQNAQISAQLNATNSQMNVLAAKVNVLEDSQAKPSPAIATAATAGARGAQARRAPRRDPRFDKLQSQVNEQGKEIAQAQTDLASTRNDLAGTRTELSGSIARTHDELVTLEKKGERNYFEFDLQKSKEFKREGPMSLSLRKANAKRQYADLTLIVDDRNVTQKHVNLDQPVTFYQPGSQQPVEIVINEITKDHIHGYVSAAKYKPSELAAASPDASDNGVVGQDQNPAASGQPAQRKRLTLSDSDLGDTGPVGANNQPAAGAQPNQQ